MSQTNARIVAGQALTGNILAVLSPDIIAALFLVTRRPNPPPTRTGAVGEGVRLPDWPRMMRRNLACRYLDMAVTEFERAVSDGTLPQPIRLGDRDRWSRTELDSYLERLAGQGEDDWRKSCKLFQDRAA